MKIVFLNLHCNHLLIRPFYFFMTNRRAISKYSYLLDYLKNNNIGFSVYTTKDGTSLPHFLAKYTEWLVFRKIELVITLIFNRIKISKVDIITSPSNLDVDDLVISFIHSPKGLETLSDFSCRKIIHLNQFCYHNLSEKLKRYGIEKMIAEARLLSIEGLFKKMYDWYSGDFILLPYTYNAKFQNNTIFTERKNKAIATGTLTLCDQALFLEQYGTNFLQPMRNTLMVEKDEYHSYFDSLITKYIELEQVVINGADCFINKLRKLIINEWRAGKQPSYFSYNLVNVYNQYKMAIVPEEAVGLPGIGFVEAMASGCAYIGIRHEMYTDLGLKPGQHYISYDGTLNDMLLKIDFYQRHPIELEKIARNGHVFVVDNFNQDVIARNFFEQLYDTNKETK